MHDLGVATAELARVAGHVGAADLDRPTPCEGWTVRDVLVHVLGLSAHFTTVARHTAPVTTETDLPADWRERLVRRLDDLAAAWREPEAWTGEGEAGGVRMSNAEFGVVALDEVVLHGWDLARALDVPFHVTDDDLAAITGFVAAFEHASEEQRAGLFGPTLPVPADASAFERILVLAGRDPRASVHVAAAAQ